MQLLINFAAVTFRFG